jgi:hypothetical protein
MTTEGQRGYMGDHELLITGFPTFLQGRKYTKSKSWASK